MAINSNALTTGTALKISATALTTGWALNITAPNSITTTGNVGINTSTALATLDVRGTSGTTPAASVSAKTSFAALVVNNSQNGDIFTASASGLTRFTVQNSGVVVIGNSTNGITFDPSGNTTAIYTGSARPVKQIVLSPEYAGAALTASGSAATVGFMTSDSSPSANFRTYYDWTTSPSTSSLQQYTVAVRTTLPKDFSAWTTNNAMTMDIYTNLATTTSNKIDILAYNASNGSMVLVDQAEKSSSAKTWRTLTYNASNLQTMSAGNTIVFYITMYSDFGMDDQIGDIVLNYLAQF